MTFRAKPVVKRDHRPSWESRDRRNLYLNIGFGLVVLLAVLILIAAAGASYYDDHFGSLSKVNGQTITKDDLRGRVAVDRFRLDRAESRLRDQLNTGRITQAEADQQLQSINQARQGIPTSSGDKLIDGALQGQLATEASIMVTDQQIDEQLKVEATVAEQRHIWEIAVRPDVSSGAVTPTAVQKAAAKTKAEAALADLKAGKKWEDVAKAASAGTSAAQGGDLAWTTKDGPFDRAFLDAVFAAQVNAPTDVVEGTDGTYRIGRATEVSAAETDPDYEQKIKDAGVPLAAYRAAVISDLTRAALNDKITADATNTATVQREVSEIFLAGTPGSAAADEVKSAHILFSPNGDPSKAKDLPADDPAWKKAEDAAKAAYAELLKDPSKFADIAKAKSDDKGSGADGGTLPWFKEAEVDPAFGAALFQASNQPGEILAPVKSQFGWHVIRFDERRADAATRIKQIHDAAAAPNADFGALAKADSEGPQAADGGKIGWVAHDQVAKDQEDAIFAAPVGGVSDVLSTQAGYYIFKVWQEATRKPDGDQLSTLKANAFSNWYAAKKAAATIDRGTIQPAAS